MVAAVLLSGKRSEVGQFYDSKKTLQCTSIYTPAEGPGCVQTENSANAAVTELPD